MGTSPDGFLLPAKGKKFTLMGNSPTSWKRRHFPGKGLEGTLDKDRRRPKGKETPSSGKRMGCEEEGGKVSFAA